jgi:hypothetical protein
LCLILASPAFAAEAAPAVDRGLPKLNLNNQSGGARSNVRWSWYDHGFLGDDFSIGSPGERWVIDSIRTWAVPGTPAASASRLGDHFEDVRLYFGASASGITPILASQLRSGTDSTADSRIRISEAAGELPYDNFGDQLRVWQIDFTGLDLVIEGGAKYRFGVWGMGRPIAGAGGKRYAWFNHASNAAFGAAGEDNADGVMLLFDAAGRFESSFSSEGSGWDKQADINVQVFARRVSSER